MEKALIVVGLVIAYLCWITKRDGEYWNGKSKLITDRRAKILQKIDNDEALTVFEFLDYYITKTVYGYLQYGIYGGLALSFVATTLFIFQPVILAEFDDHYRPLKKTQVPIQSKKIHSFSTEYKGLRVGSSTLSDVVKVLGTPLSKINNSNNINYRFGGVDITIQDGTGRINTIIIYDPKYTDVNGYKVGTAYDVISKDLHIYEPRKTLLEKSNGVIYWFKNQRVSRIVYAAQLKL